MLDDIKIYMSTTKAAADLALSVGAVKNLITQGELNAIRSLSGRWRIFTSSIDDYRKRHNYKDRSKKGKICILHLGHGFDPLLLESLDPAGIQLLTNPLELLEIGPHISVLFMDARYMLFEATSHEMIKDFQKQYKILIYNSQALPAKSPFLQMPGTVFVPNMINAQFIAGYDVGQRFETKRSAKH